MSNKSIKKLIKQEDILIAPGVFDGMSAILVENAGFPLIYASGGAISRGLGYPDIGLISFTEQLNILQHMANVTSTPIIADADTGYGNEVNVKRTTKSYIQAGISGLHIEDQLFPKRCGHLDDKSLISTSDMQKKISVAKDTAISNNEEFLIVARTDAIAVENIEAALERTLKYIEAGADMIFVEAPESFEQIELIANEIKHPKMINMFYGGRTPLVPKDTLRELGYNIIIIPSDLQRASIFACQKVLEEIILHGDSSKIKDKLVSFSEREEIVKTSSYLGL